MDSKKRTFAQTTLAMAGDVIMGAALKRVAKDVEEKVFGRNPGVQQSNVVSSVPRSVHSTVTSTTVGAYENVTWGHNPFPNLNRYSVRRSRAEREAVRTGIAYSAPGMVTDWDFGSIWSARKQDDGKGGTAWSSNGQQGTCAWYAFPTISPADYDKAYAAAWTNDSTVDAAHLTSIESFINTLEFRNVGASPCEVTVYQCWPRDDIPITTGAAGLIPTQYSCLYQGSQADRLNGPDLFTKTDFKAWQPVLSGSVSISPNAYDMTPFKHPIWRQLFKCRPYYNRIMAPGDSTRATFGTWGTKFLDPADDLQGDNTNMPTQLTWAYKTDMGPIYLMRVRGTMVHGESTGTNVLLTNGTTVSSGEGHPDRCVVNFGNYCVDYAWKSNMYFRAIGSADTTLEQLGYYGGTYPRNTSQTWDVQHEFTRVPNNPAEIANFA